jgi:DNA-binding response OmpR family regulator
VARTAVIVDDEPDLATGCARFLKQIGLDSILAFSVESAIPLMRSHGLALLLTDVVFPNGRDGFELVELVRKHPPLTPVIVMSGYHSPAMEAQARNAGASFLRKPFSGEQLISTVRSILP